MPLATGAKAPAITVTGETSSVVLPYPSEAAVIFFYPTNQGSTCVTEVVDFDRRSNRFLSLGVRVAGVTTEPIGEVASLRRAKRLALTLCSDPLGEASNLFGVRNAHGFADRYTFLISKDGTVLEVWQAYDTSGHAEEVLKECARLFRQ